MARSSLYTAQSCDSWRCAVSVLATGLRRCRPGPVDNLGSSHATTAGDHPIPRRSSGPIGHCGYAYHSGLWNDSWHILCMFFIPRLSVADYSAIPIQIALDTCSPYNRPVVPGRAIHGVSLLHGSSYRRLALPPPFQHEDQYNAICNA